MEKIICLLILMHRTLTFIVEPVESVDGFALVIAAQQEEVLRVLDPK